MKTVGVMGLRPTEADEKRLLSSNHSPSECHPFLPSECHPFLVIPSEAEGSAVPRTSPGNAEFYAQTELSSRPERSEVEGPAGPPASVEKHFHERSAELQIPRLRSG